jgi:hypothetical protein
MLGIIGSKRKGKDKEEAIHPPGQNCLAWRENCWEERALLFPKQGKAPLIYKKKCFKRQSKEKSITSEKYLKMKCTFEIFYLKICNQRMTIIYGKRKNSFPLP